MSLVTPFDDSRLRETLGTIGVDPSTARIDRLGEDFGFGGAVWRVEAGSISVVVKRETAERTRRCLLALGAVAAPLQGRVPRVLDGWVDEADDFGIVIFEFVAPAVQGDVLVGASPARLDALVDLTASIHGIPPPESLPEFTITAWERARWLDTVDRAHRRYPEVVGPRRDWLEGEYWEQVGPAIERLVTLPRTLIHGDLHADNLLWRPGVLPVVLDWSNASVGPPVVDLVSPLMGGGVSPADRQRFLDTYAERTGNDRDALRGQFSDARLWLTRGVVGFAGKEEEIDRPRFRAVRDHAISTLLSEDEPV